MAIPTEFHITHTCGHRRTIDLAAKPAGERNSLAEWYAKKDCLDCYRAKSGSSNNSDEWKEQQRLEAAEAAERDELPQLTGSQKQASWALTVRHQLLKTAYESLVEESDMTDDDYTAQVIEPARLIDAARWWIDNRDTLPEDLPELLNDPGTLMSGASTENPFTAQAAS